MARCIKCGRKYRMNWVRYDTCPTCRGGRVNMDTQIAGAKFPATMEDEIGKVRLEDTGERRYPKAGEYYGWWGQIPRTDSEDAFHGPCKVDYNVVGGWNSPPEAYAIYRIVANIPGENYPRDTVTAAALGVEVAGFIPRDGILTDIMKCETWEEAINRIDLAAAAIDHERACYPHPPGFWHEYDWYLTLDKVAAELVARPDAPWDSGRLRACLVLV